MQHECLAVRLSPSQDPAPRSPDRVRDLSHGHGRVTECPRSLILPHRARSQARKRPKHIPGGNRSPIQAPSPRSYHVSGGQQSPNPHRESLKPCIPHPTLLLSSSPPSSHWEAQHPQITSSPQPAGILATPAMVSRLQARSVGAGMYRAEQPRSGLGCSGGAGLSPRFPRDGTGNLPRSSSPNSGPGARHSLTGAAPEFA